MDCIPANPDISGIGVRIAIYAQNLLCFLPVILYLWDGEISVDELVGIQDQSTGMLAIAFAILITTASLAAGRNPTVSYYHAAIILDLSWMNNTSTWIWFILYVYERSKAEYKPVAATWSAWWTVLRSRVRTYLHGLDPAGSGMTHGGEGLQKVVKRLWNSLPIQWVRQFARLILAAPVLTLGSIHLSMMAAIGIWLWYDPAGFGMRIDRCTPTLTVFGVSVSFNSRPLRIFSLTMYAIVLIPGLNLLLPFAFFLFLHISYNHVRTTVLRRREGRAERGGATSASVGTRVHTAFLYIGLSCLVAINLLFIVDTELTLQRNMHNQSNEERVWGFGQILALLLLLVPLRDAWTALRNIQNNTQQRFEQAFRTVAEAGMAQVELSTLLDKGARPQQQIPGRFGGFLQLAAYYGNEDLIQLLLQKNVNVDAVGGDYWTALQAAAARGHEDIVQILIGAGADPNTAGGDYGTALCAACANGHVDVVNILLEQNGIDNRKGSEFGAPLHIAILLGTQNIVERLIEDTAAEADCQWRDTQLKALDIAAIMGKEEIFHILKEKRLTGVRGGRAIACNEG